MNQINDSIVQYLQKVDPQFFEIYSRFVTVPSNNNVIDAKSIELINIALNASPTSLCKETLEMHMNNAVSLGATEQEILEVLKLVSALGIHSCGVGVPILMEEIQSLDNQPKVIKLDDEQQKLKDEFIQKKGYFKPFHDVLLENDKDFFESYYDYLANPLETDVLDPKLKEFIYIAVNSSTTHLYVAGIRIHIRHAMNHGATFEEIMEVFKLTSAQGMNTFHIGIPILKALFSDGKV